MSEEFSDKELAKLVVSGQKKYFGEIIKRFETRIFSMVKRYLYNAFGMAYENEAMDLMQEIWINIYKGLKKYDPERSELATFIYKIAENKCMDFLRSKMRKLMSLTDFDSDVCGEEDSDRNVSNRYISTNYKDDPIKYYVIKTVIKKIFYKVEELPEFLRNLLTLRFIANISEKEVAEMRGSTVSAIRSNISRACKMLIVSLGDFSNPDEVVKLLRKGAFAFTKEEVADIRNPRVKKFLKYMIIRREPLEKVFQVLKCNTKKSRDKLLEEVTQEILKFQRMRKPAKMDSQKIVKFFFSTAKDILRSAPVLSYTSPGIEILKRAKQKNIELDQLRDILKISDSELMKLISDRLPVSKRRILARRIKKLLGIPISHFSKKFTGDRMLLSIRDAKRERMLLDAVRRKVLAQLRISRS